ncbi:hypothetical protein SARC_03585 [Sphaeroforma arctica JP610]|uniref:RGS domain-containing protein n=1 Tax=Sphaeroforma arctica JP610 TaxID=667725 RepID=A0A0L0G5T5_9EUKA|nr:hypothetical protein SARC_03585 [Sphaeroforma arctica JP610]KNC84196.1 hypothetical protein SARC_03585 [Sphaeroforma arctica JP610]|eukprot:XP_014158098.1 hypothetical protein SARC_03585 [Sphaeroforma arctica JP610]
MALTITIEIFVYCCFCSIFILTIPIFFWRRRYTLISERTPYLVLWMQVPVFGLMTILCLLYSALIPNSYDVTILARCLQTLFLCSVTTRIVNVVIKSIQQQHIQSIIRNQMPLLGAPSDTKNPDSGRSGTVQYMWWQSAHLIKLGRSLGLSICAPEPSQVLEAGTCSHYTYGCLFFVHVLSILVPALLTFIPVMRTQRVLPLSNAEQVKEGAGDNDDSSAFGLKCSAALDSHTPLDTDIGVIDAERTAQNNDTSYFPVEQPLQMTMVLANRSLASMFYKHLSREYATENFLFLLSINKFRSRFNMEMCIPNSTTGKTSTTQNTGSNLRRVSVGSNTIVSEMIEQVFVDTSSEQGAVKHKSSEGKIKNSFSTGIENLAGVQGLTLQKVSENVSSGDTQSDMSTSDAQCSGDTAQVDTSGVQCQSVISKVANRIYQRFIRTSAEFQVNLSYEYVANIEWLLESDDCFATMFDEAACSVTNLLDNDTISRFKKLHSKAIYKALRMIGSMGGSTV